MKQVSCTPLWPTSVDGAWPNQSGECRLPARAILGDGEAEFDALWPRSERQDVRRREYGGLCQRSRRAPPSQASYTRCSLGGQAAAIVPLPDLHRLQAVERRAPSEVIQQAEIETTLAAHRECVAAGRSGAVSREQAMAELLAEP